jgi:uncharacterized protein (DUF1501 family)
MKTTQQHYLELLLSRRQVLRASAASALGATLTSGGMQIALAQPSSALQGDTTARLIVVMLRGAMDGLSLVAPYADPNYYRARGSIAIARPGEADGLIALDNLFGLHPAAAALLPYWESKQLAFIHASGSPDPTRSHFDAQDYMESATPGRKSTPDGWLNRLAAVLGSTQRLQAVNLGPTMPRIFSGDAAVSSLASGNAAIAKGVLDRPNVATAFNALYAGEDRLSQAMREASLTRKEILESFASDDPKADIGSLSLSGLAKDTTRLGQLMARDARVRLAFVPVGGWDTHANQGNGKGQLANRFQLLAQALDSLAKALGDRLAQTSILVISEFGRTVKQNGTNGTDHGHGNVAWVMGGNGSAGANGGKVLGRWPGLEASALYEGRDLAITTDFRDIIAEILERRFGLRDNELTNVLPAMKTRQRVGV